MENDRPIFALLIAGGRNFTDGAVLARECGRMLQDVAGTHRIVVIEGEARGTDTEARKYAEREGYEVIPMPADWDQYGRSAGFRRNAGMHEVLAGYPARGALCFWDGESRGTQHNFLLAKRHGTPLRVYDYVRGRYLSEQELAPVIGRLEQEDRRYRR